MANLAFLHQTLEYIKTHPNQWNQATWRCGTGMCFAGWACTLAGGHWYDIDGDIAYLDIEPEDDHSRYEQFTDLSFPLIHVQDRAQRLLDLDDDICDALFIGSNTLEDLERIVAEIEEEEKDERPAA